ncbi:MAG: tetratricopeptide repeat protein, partial [Anaerolineales bacterium]
AVLGRADSAECLRQAEARRLFVSAVGDEFRAYQYHHLFRDFLLARLRAQDPERLRRLQIRAADWYAENGMAEAAVTFYALAGQLPQAAAVAEANAQTLFEAGRHATLRRWAEQLAPLAHDVPTLYLSLARADIDGGDLAAAEVELETAALGFARHADEAGALKVEVQRSMVRYQRGEFDHALAIAQVVVPKARTLQQATTEAVALRYAGLCQFALGQLAAAEESLQQVVQLLQEPEQRYNLAWTLNDLALVMRARGQTAQAARAQQQALTLWHESAAPGPLALALNNIGWDLHMLGQYQAALATYDEALDWAQRAGNIRLEALIVTGRADVLADLGHRSIATELYRQAIVKAERADDWALTAYLCRAMARLDRWDGKFVSALEWLRRAVLASRRGQATSPLANLDGLRGMILVEIGHVQEGRPILAEVCADLERLGALVDLAQTLLFLAYAEFRAGEAEAAQASLARALAVAEQVGYDQMLVSEALSVRDLLEAFRHQSDIGPRVALLLARAERMSAAEGKTVLTSAAPLSSRPEIQSNATLQICALGSSRVQKMGFEIPRTAWVSQRTRELFFFLIDRAPIPRDQVLEVFWPEKPPARALANLYQTLYRMRRAIGTEVVILEDQECRLSPTLSQDYDVQHFEAEAQAALSLPDGDLRRLSALNAAIQLYTGEYLADLPVGWAGARRQSLNDLHVNLLGAYADALMGLTRYAEAREV